MTKQIFIGLFTEGKTDIRFLESIVKRTFDEVALECYGEVETDIRHIKINKTSLNFVEQVLKASSEGLENYGIMILCVHTDADNQSDYIAYQNKINPSQIALNNKNDDKYCKILAAIVPVQMIEAWMLADKSLFKKEIGTEISDEDLKINRDPETISNPKIIIEEAIRIARADLTKRRRGNLTISELYLPLGQKTPIEKLDFLPSFLKFKESIRATYRKLNYMP